MGFTVGESRQKITGQGLSIHDQFYAPTFEAVRVANLDIISRATPGSGYAHFRPSSRKAGLNAQASVVGFSPNQLIDQNRIQPGVGTRDPSVLLLEGTVFMLGAVVAIGVEERRVALGIRRTGEEARSNTLEDVIGFVGLAQPEQAKNHPDIQVGINGAILGDARLHAGDATNAGI